MSTGEGKGSEEKRGMKGSEGIVMGGVGMGGRKGQRNEGREGWGKRKGGDGKGSKEPPLKILDPPLRPHWGSSRRSPDSLVGSEGRVADEK